jgi:uncharacterized protein YlxW (UPF0749 family)
VRVPQVQLERSDLESERQQRADLASEITQLSDGLASVGKSTERQLDIVKLNLNMIQSLEV